MTSEFNDFNDFSHHTHHNLTHYYVADRNLPPLPSSRQMFSVNNYYVVTYISLKKQAQRQGLIGSPQHSCVLTFNTYDGKKSTKQWIHVPVLDKLVNISYLQKKHSHVYTSYIEILDFLEGKCVKSWQCVAHKADRMSNITKLQQATFSLCLDTPSFPLDRTWCNSQISSLFAPIAHVNTATDMWSNARTLEHSFYNKGHFNLSYWHQFNPFCTTPL